MRQSDEWRGGVPSCAVLRPRHVARYLTSEKTVRTGVPVGLHTDRAGVEQDQGKAAACGSTDTGGVARGNRAALAAIPHPRISRYAACTKNKSFALQFCSRHILARPPLYLIHRALHLGSCAAIAWRYGGRDPGGVRRARVHRGHAGSCIAWCAIRPCVGDDAAGQRARRVRKRVWIGLSGTWRRPFVA